MKPPRFEYEQPKSLDAALDLLAEHGDDAKVLAGGQSLVPLLNFRLARPSRLVDINALTELDYLRFDNGTLRIGALTRHSRLERSAEAAQRVPLLSEAVRLVGHVQIRNRGTVGGSVAHADPTAELPVAFAALDATYRIKSTNGERVVRSDELFLMQLTTSLRPDELLTEIEVEIPPPRTGAAFVEFARRHGDFALGGAAALLTVAADGTCERARIALLGAGSTPMRASDAEGWLAGLKIDESTAAEAATRAIAGIHPTGDIHGSAGYRRGLVEVMVRRALLLAGERSMEAA